MKRGFWSLFLILFLAGPLFGRLSYSEWKNIQREFNQEFSKKKKEAIQAVKKLKNYDDPRVAELLIRKGFSHSDPFVILEAKKVLGSFRNPKTLDRIVSIVSRERKVELKFQLILVMGNFGKDPKVTSFLKNSLRDRNWKILSATLRAIGM
ncbi:MAG: HEAT repeat domain-containing protein, partial [Planctomycetota bacterium]